MNLRFTKMQGAGNDFVVIDATRSPLELTAEQARHLGDRRFGVGCDQILVIEPSLEAGIDFRYRIFNGADGSEVEHCGNGARCVGWLRMEEAGTDSVRFDTAAGTLEVVGPLGTVTIKPQVADGGLNLQVLQVTGLGFTLPRETVQPALDAFTEQLTRNLPMGIRAESVGVTDSGVAARFVTRNATIPNAEQDPCFAGL
jgi:hypothetical protein